MLHSSLHRNSVVSGRTWEALLLREGGVLRFLLKLRMATKMYAQEFKNSFEPHLPLSVDRQQSCTKLLLRGAGPKYTLHEQKYSSTPGILGMTYQMVYRSVQNVVQTDAC